MCCTRLAESTWRKKSPSWHYRTTLSGCIFAQRGQGRGQNVASLPLHPWSFISDIAVFVLKRGVILQPTNQHAKTVYRPTDKERPISVLTGLDVEQIRGCHQCRYRVWNRHWAPMILSLHTVHFRGQDAYVQWCHRVQKMDTFLAKAHVPYFLA